MDLLRAYADICVSDADFEMGAVSVAKFDRHPILDLNLVKLNLDALGHAIVFFRSPKPYYRDRVFNDWPIPYF